MKVRTLRRMFFAPNETILRGTAGKVIDPPPESMRKHLRAYNGRGDEEWVVVELCGRSRYIQKCDLLPDEEPARVLLG
jgi:hypothetical protein